MAAYDVAVQLMSTLATRFTLTLPGHCTPEQRPWPSTNLLLAEAGNLAAGDYIASRKRV